MTLSGRSIRAFCSVWLLPILLLLAPPAIALGQSREFTYTNNDAVFYFMTNQGKITITGCVAFGAVSIPSTIPVGGIDLPVTFIGADGFWGPQGSQNTHVTSVVIPDSVLNIGVEAFDGCLDLTNVTLGGGLTNIALSAFQDCSALAAITIPNGVVSIGSCAFFNCFALSQITLGGKVTTIGNAAFEDCFGLTNVTLPAAAAGISSTAFLGCSALTNISVDAASTNYAGAGGVLFDYKMTTLMIFPEGRSGPYVIPDGVVRIGTNAFEYAYYLTDVTIPGSVASIGDWAFADCVLTNVTIPDSVTNLGEFAFYDCENLASATVLGRGACIGGDAFADCYSLTNLTLGDDVTRIGNEAFCDCTSLASVTIPAAVTNIVWAAFSGCANLVSAYFMGNAPAADTNIFTTYPTNDPTTVYYRPGTLGWGSTFAGQPTALRAWPDPFILSGGWGAPTNAFGFTFLWATNGPVVIDACTDLAAPAWCPLCTNTLANGANYFTDPQWTNHPSRFYRVRSP